MSEVSVRSLVAFLRSVAILALDAPDQLNWLLSLGLPGEPAVADELALEFDDRFHLVPAFIANGWLQDDAIEFLGPIDAALAAMSAPANNDIWSVDALKSDEAWEQVRQLARKALTLL